MPRGSTMAAHEAYASIERRAAAHLIDLVIAWGLSCVFLFYGAAFIASVIPIAGNESVWWGMTLLALWVLGFALYFAVGLMVWSTTVGKFLFGLRVADAVTFRDVTPMQAVLRSAAQYVSWLPLFLPFIIVFFDHPQRRAIHDHVAGTVVLRDLRRHGRPGFCVLLAGIFLAVIGMTITAFIIGVNS